MIEILGKDRSISSHPEVVIYKILQLNTLYIYIYILHSLHSDEERKNRKLSVYHYYKKEWRK